MLITRKWAMPNGKTFRISPIKEFVEDAVLSVHADGVIVDPFANECLYGTVRNDLNPEFSTDFHMDALAFLKQQPDESADLVLYDPPYSITQAATLYKAYSKEKLEINVANMKYWAECKNNIARIVKPGGVCLGFGWNTNGIGKGRGFSIDEILIVAHGGSKNDTLCGKETKRPAGETHCLNTVADTFEDDIDKALAYAHDVGFDEGYQAAMDEIE